MPIATVPVRARREADNEVARRFGRHKASVHSPTPQRPGTYGDAIVATVLERGYELATADGRHPERAFIEVFPLAALVRCLQVDERPKYKVGKTTSYWRIDEPRERRRKLRDEWLRIEEYLQSEIASLPRLVPPNFLTLPASRLKPHEDAMDAIICALVGAFYIEDAVEALGDAQAAIWVPASGAKGKADSLEPAS
jgi:predicted RNase H-like nuclease